MQPEDFGADAPLLSTYANDEAIAEILPMFINNMPRYVSDLEMRLANGDWTAAARVCHDLKGTAGGYGFPEIGRATQLLESEIKGPRNPESLQHHLQTVKVLCSRARLGIDPAHLH